MKRGMTTVGEAPEQERDPRVIEKDEKALFEGQHDAVLAAVFGEALAARIHDGERFRAWTFAGSGHARCVIELADASRENVLWHEAGINFDADCPDVDAARPRIVEFLHDEVAHWLGADRWPPPHLDFKEYEHDGASIWMRGQQLNEALDSLAERWLAENDPEHADAGKSGE